MPDFKVPLTLSPLSVKDFLRRQAGLSLTLWRKIKTHGKLVVNTQPAAISQVVYPGDIISVTWPNDSAIIAEDLPLDIMYEDEWLLAINKPAGMLVHPAAGRHSGTLANAIMYYYHQQSFDYGFHPVNRLDRNTSGLVLIAKRPDIQHMLNENQQQIKKQYLAVCAGVPSPTEGFINAPIARKPGSIIERTVSPEGQYALTQYGVLTAFDTASLLKIVLETGRTHQIRVHLSHIGCPLLGDDLYGGPVDLIQRQALHAARLSLPHPVTKEAIVVTSPLPADLNNLISQLGDQITYVL